ncbi:MAG: hypothetical protein HZB33_03165, partial [Nitrospirae bacterium]|nr:hypothetical protein [Nitrospirota bacterium]
MNNRGLLSRGLVLVFSTVLIFVFASGQSLAADPWTEEYLADDLPQAANPAWIKTIADNVYLGDEVTYSLVENSASSVFHTNVIQNIVSGAECGTCHNPAGTDLSPSANHWPVSYVIQDNLLSNSKGTTVEARVWKSNAAVARLGISISDGDYSEILWIGSSGIRLSAAGSNVSYGMTPEDGYHTYRMTLQGTTVLVYVDGVLQLTGASPISSINPYGTTGKYIKFGVYTGHGTTSPGTDGDWDYVKYYNGAPFPTVGMKLWLKADAGVTKDGSNFVSAWADQSGYGNNAQQAAAGLQPLFVSSGSNGRPAVRFDGIDDFMDYGTNDLIGNSGFTIAAALRLTDASQDTVSPLSVRTVNADEDVYFGIGKNGNTGLDGKSPWFNYSCAANIVGSPEIFSDQFTTESIVALSHNGGAKDNAANYSFIKDGVSQVLSVYVPGGGCTPQPGMNEIGDLNGDISEIIVYDRQLSVSETASLSDYLTSTHICPAFTLSPATLPNGTAGAAYSQTVTASGGTGPYTYAVTAGALPGGLGLSSGGALTGTPPAIGVSNLTVTATDANACVGSRAYSLTVDPVICNWASAVSGNWSDGTKWSCGHAPGAADHTIITVDGTYTVTLDVSATVNSFSLGGASGTQTLSASSRTLMINAASVIGNRGVINLTSSTISGTGQLNNEGTINLYGSTVNTALDNAGTINVDYGSAINGAFTTQAGSALTVSSKNTYSWNNGEHDSSLTVANGFINNGSITLTTANDA